MQGLPPDRFASGSAINQAVRNLGPTFGVGARYEMGNGMFLFGKAGVSLDFHRGSGSWSR